MGFVYVCVKKRKRERVECKGVYACVKERELERERERGKRRD